MKDKVLLIYSPSPVMNREDRCQQPTDDLIVIPPLPPSDLLYMASIARMAGKIPYVKDYSLNNQTMDDFIRDFKEINPDYLVINVASTTLNKDLAVLSAAKEINPDVTIIGKGAHFNMFDIKTLEDYREKNSLERLRDEDIQAAMRERYPKFGFGNGFGKTLA